MRELLATVDGRMVIVNAGDEIRLKFAALPPAGTPGSTRDYVMVGDGWIKDGDLNSTFSKTVTAAAVSRFEGLRIGPWQA